MTTNPLAGLVSSQNSSQRKVASSLSSLNELVNSRPRNVSKDKELSSLVLCASASNTFFDKLKGGEGSELRNMALEGLRSGRLTKEAEEVLVKHLYEEIENAVRVCKDYLINREPLAEEAIYKHQQIVDRGELFMGIGRPAYLTGWVGTGASLVLGGLLVAGAVATSPFMLGAAAFGLGASFCIGMFGHGFMRMGQKLRIQASVNQGAFIDIIGQFTSNDFQHSAANRALQAWQGTASNRIEAWNSGTNKPAKASDLESMRYDMDLLLSETYYGAVAVTVKTVIGLAESLRSAKSSAFTQTTAFRNWDVDVVNERMSGRDSQIRDMNTSMRRGAGGGVRPGNPRTRHERDQLRRENDRDSARRDELQAQRDDAYTRSQARNRFWIW